MKDKLLLIWKHLKPENLQKMWLQSKWIWQYGKRYWKSMVVYTLLGIAGSGVSLVSSFISKDLIDIITGHQTGKLLSTFAAMIGFSIANILFSQASTYASTFINLKVDSEIKNDNGTGTKAMETFRQLFHEVRLLNASDLGVETGDSGEPNIWKTSCECRSCLGPKKL